MFGVPRDGYERLSSDQVLGLAHAILGEATMGEATVDLLFALARARVDLLTDLFDLLGAPAMQTYPGRYQRAVESWADAVRERPEDDGEKQAVEALREGVAQRHRGFEIRKQAGDIVFAPTRYTAAAIHERTQRAMQVMMRQNESPFMALMPRVPLACGEASAFDQSDDPEHISPLARFETQFEGHWLEAHDPVAARFARVVHQQHAARLLGEEREGS